MGRLRKTVRYLIHLKPRGFWPGFILGFAYFGVSFFWFWSLYPLDSLGISNPVTGTVIIFTGYIISVVTMASFWGLCSLFAFKVLIAQKYIFPVYFGAIFVLTEYLRAWGFGIIWLGGNNPIGPHWTLANPAYLLDFSPIIKSSALWGIYGVDFFLAVFLASVWLIFKDGEKRIFFLQAGLVVTIFLTAHFALKPQVNSMDVDLSIIQTKNPVKTSYTSNELIDDFSKKSQLLRDASKNSDIVVFPETSLFSQTISQFLEPAAIKKYFDKLNSDNVLILDHNRIKEGERLSSKVVLVDSKDGFAGSYDKQLLTPGGEYVPYIIFVPVWLYSLFYEPLFKDYVEFRPGTNSEAITYDGIRLKILVCSDIISPDISSRGDFGLMIGLNNLAIFNGNSLTAREIRAMARFRAAENGRYFVLASNFGRSYIINPEGKVENGTDSLGYEILSGRLGFNDTRTPYSRVKDWPVLIVSLGLFIFGTRRAK